MVPTHMEIKSHTIWVLSHLVIGAVTHGLEMPVLIGRHHASWHLGKVHISDLKK